MLWIVCILIVITYSFASATNAILISRLFNYPDPREYGSGNVGTTNVFRYGSPFLTLGVLLNDVLKGLLPVWIGQLFSLTPLALEGVALAACLGHQYPIFFRFQGGKGVATAWGSILLISWQNAIFLLFSWLLITKLSRYVSLGSIIVAFVAPFSMAYFQPQYVTWCIGVSCLVLIRHRDNARRLLARKEHSIDKRL